MSRGFAMLTNHPSGSRPGSPRRGGPARGTVVPQKAVRAMPCPTASSRIRWLAPFVVTMGRPTRRGSRRGRMVRAPARRCGGGPIRSRDSMSNPRPGSPPPGSRSAETTARVERHPITHHVEARPRQLVRRRRIRRGDAGLGPLALVEPLGAVIVVQHELRRLDEHPGEMNVAASAIACPSSCRSTVSPSARSGSTKRSCRTRRNARSRRSRT